MKYLKEKLDTLSDAIIAIIMTIMVLEIQLPKDNGQLLDFFHSIALFAVTFTVIANIWYRRTKMMAMVKILPIWVVFIDIVAHGIMSLIPLFMKMLMNYHDRQLAIIMYGVVIWMFIFIYDILETYIFVLRFNLLNNTNPNVKRVVIFRQIIKMLFKLILFLVASTFPNFGFYLYVFYPFINIITNYINAKRIENWQNVVRGNNGKIEGNFHNKRINSNKKT